METQLTPLTYPHSSVEKVSDWLSRKKVMFDIQEGSLKMPPGLEDLDKSEPMYVPTGAAIVEKDDDLAWCRSTASGSAGESSEGDEGEREKHDLLDDDGLEGISHLLSGMTAILSDDGEDVHPSSSQLSYWEWGTPAYLRPKNFCAWCGVPRDSSHTFCPQCGVAFALLD